MKKPGFLLLMFLAFNSFAQSLSFTEFNQLYQSGQYAKAIKALEKINQNDKENTQGQKSYLAGLCYSKLQEYDQAIKSFELAIKENNDAKDLYYEYGQALYAANELKAARSAFKESSKKKFNVPASTYYVAHISQILEEYPEAKDNYTLLIKNKETEPKIRQIARFQLAETLLVIMRQKIQNKESLERGVDKDIVPMMKQAYDSDKTTQVSGEIDLRLHEILKEFNLDPDLMINGRKLSPKRYSGYFSQKIKFDDNISLTNEENNTTQSKKESFIFESEAYAKYDYNFKKKFIVSPEVRINFVQNSDQDSPEVYQNDSLSLNFNVKNKYEHTLYAQPASFLFDIEYAKNYKDYQETHSRKAYANSVTLGIGEQFTYFSVGDTTFKLKQKKYTGTDSSINNNTTTLSADQTAALPNQHLVIGLFEADLTDNINNTSTSTNSFLTRVDYLIPDIMPKDTLDLALAFTVTDTKEQKATRGTETTLNPSIDLSKEINQRMKISVNYDYTKNKSKLSDYSYQKSVFSTEFRYSF